MFEFSWSWITGMMVGIEFPPAQEMSEDLVWCMALDLLIGRIVILKWRTVDGD